MKMDRATRIKIEDRLEVMATLLRKELLGDYLACDRVCEDEIEYEIERREAKKNVKKRVAPKKEVAPSLLGRLFQKIAR